jgi:hypothetical protein
MRLQIRQQPSENLTPQRAGIPTALGELLLAPMPATVDDLSDKREFVQTYWGLRGAAGSQGVWSD